MSRLLDYAGSSMVALHPKQTRDIDFKPALVVGLYLMLFLCSSLYLFLNTVSYLWYCHSTVSNGKKSGILCVLLQCIADNFCKIFKQQQNELQLID